MVVSHMTKLLFSLSILVLLPSIEAHSSINKQALNVHNNAQMVNLSLQYKSKNKLVKSNLLMPFYQTAELERLIGDKNILIEINPKRGKSANEISLEMKFYKAAGLKAFYKKEIMAKINEDAHIKFRGMNLKVRPVVN